MVLKQTQRNMFTAKIYGREIKANTLKGIKAKASRIANDYWKPIDEMEVIHTDSEGREVTRTKWVRINKKCPNNTITYGQWK